MQDKTSRVNSTWPVTQFGVKLAATIQTCSHKHRHSISFAICQ
jgi:hypothetical protein